MIFTVYPEHFGDVTVRVDFSMVPFDAGAFAWFWCQVAIAALLTWATQQDRGPSINVDGKWFTWMVWFQQEWAR